MFFYDVSPSTVKEAISTKWINNCYYTAPHHPLFYIANRVFWCTLTSHAKENRGMIDFVLLITI